MDAGQPPARGEAVEAAALGGSWGSLPTRTCRESVRRVPIRHTDTANTHHEPLPGHWPQAHSLLPFLCSPAGQALVHHLETGLTGATGAGDPGVPSSYLSAKGPDPTQGLP